MLFRILICLILLIIGHSIFAQTRPTDDTQEEESTRKVSHYIGIQANQLVRQLISFGGNSTPVANPYLLIYSVNSKAHGFGFTTGLGYSSQEVKNGDQFTSFVNKINDFAWRFGLDKKTYLAKNWLLGFGGDILIESNKDETTTKSNNVSTSITTTEKRSGFGPRVSLNYQFHKKLLFGTEAAYYFRWINQKQTSTGTSQPNDPGTKLKSYSFSLPTVLYLIIKL